MERKPLITIIVLVIIAAIFVSWTIIGLVSPAVIKVEVSGSTTVLPIASSCAEEFMDENDNYDIQVTGGGSSVGVSNAGEGTTDIGMASRDVKSSELEDYPDLYVYGVAKDGLAVCVNDGNEITDLNFTVIQYIFNGTWDEWEDVDSNTDLNSDLTGEIVVLGRDSNSGTRATFEELTEVGDCEYDQELASNGEVADKIGSTENAIGYLGLGYTGEDGVSDVTVKGVEAKKETVQDGTYELSRDLFMITNGKPSEAEKTFIDFILSDAGQEIVEEEGYIALGDDYENPHIKP
ncbi:MAG: phosphate ABC transporter substrate-binding protein [Promethearchaeia archaeon]